MRLQRPNKYGARAVLVNGIRFHSVKEAERYRQLAFLEKAHYIGELKLQPKFAIDVNNKLICHYIADFSYFDRTQEVTIVEDVKGYRTDVYKLKKKLFLALYPQYQFVES